VPVYLSNEDYAKNGSAPAEEKAERDRIYHEAVKAKLSTGTVHVYIVNTDGHPIDSLHVAQASKVDEMTTLLERVVENLHIPAGQPLGKPHSQSAPPPAKADALVLHLTARNLRRDGNDWLPVKPKLGETRSSGWGSYAAEDWIVLEKESWRKMLPTGECKVGTSWEIDKEAAAQVLTHVYPSTENNNLAKNRIDRQELKATVLSVKDGVARARLDGSLRMKHPFYHKDDDNFVEATLVGFFDFDPGSKIRTLQLATVKATYGRPVFGAVVRSLP